MTMDTLSAPPPLSARRRVVTLALLCAVVAVALWEGGLALYAPRAAARTADWEAAAALVRAGFQPGDLIVFAPAWADQVGRSVLGDLMPAAMVGRPDAARYPRIWEIAARGARHRDTAALQPQWQSAAGPLRVARYHQTPVTVSYDLVERYAEARVTQVPLSGAGTLAERPCFFVGDPAASAGRGDLPAFRCSGSRVERRVMEIDYQPRYGVVVQAEAGQRTELTYADVPAAALRGATLVLYAGLHDYYARKTESGPVDVEVSLEPGAARARLRVRPDGGWQVLRLPLPDLQGQSGSLRVAVSAADARARYLGFAAELRR